MNILSTPRGILAFDEDKAVLEKIQANWPFDEPLRITEHKAEERKHSRRKGRSE